MSREHLLHKIRTALGRSAGQAPEEAPPPRLVVEPGTDDERLRRFARALEKLNGKVWLAASAGEASGLVAQILAGRRAVMSGAPFLVECGIGAVAGVASGLTDRAELRDACATADAGITSADYALADTGSLVVFSTLEESRLISLLPPCHIAVVPRTRLLSGLDELLTLIPLPGERSSSMVVITGPSRTADIEQILVRGVHGPGEIHVVLV